MAFLQYNWSQLVEPQGPAVGH